MKPVTGNTELDQLASAAAGVDKGILFDRGEAGVPEGEVAPAVDPVEEWAQLPTLFGQIVVPAMPELETVFTPEACRRWGQAMAPLAQKHGWNVADVIAWAGPWIGVAMASIPLVVPTVRAVTARVKARKEEAANDDQGRPSATVTAIKPAAPGPAAPGDDPDLRDPTKTNKPPRPA